MSASKQRAGQKYQHERFRIIFEYSPIAIWEEDFSILGKLRTRLKTLGVKDSRDYLSKHIDVVKQTFRGLKVLDVNRAALDLYGAKTKKELMSNLGRTFHKEAIPVLIDEFASLLEGKEVFEAVFKSKTLDGRVYDVAMKVSVPEIYKESFKRVVVTLRDISVQKRYERHLKRLAQTDGLTKVLNHSAISYRLEEEFMRAKRYHLDLSCMMIDLDNFKDINDHYGHQKGDQVLKRTAKLIKQNLRDVDVVGRYGGDEFLVILPETSPESAKVAAMRLKNFFSNLLQNKHTVYSTLSIGVGGRPSANVNSAKDLIIKIDKAMYASKKNGRNQMTFVS